MEPFPRLTAQDVVDIRIEAGLYDSADSMLVGYPYRVIEVQVSEQENEIFVVLDHPFFDEIRVINVPQRSHEPLRRLLIIMRLNNVKNFFWKM
jgi:hypothetical protein